MDATRCLDDLEKDFEYKYSNDSRSWIVEYPGSLKADPNELKISMNNDTYRRHEIQRSEKKGKRKKLMEAFYRKIVTEEVLRQLGDDKIAIEAYVTDYMERFKNPDDMPLPGEELSKNEKIKNCGGVQKEVSQESKLQDLKAKYPLYLSTPLTYFSHTTGRSHFRKNATITKSPDQNYDNIEY